MRVVYAPDHEEHCPPHELERGYFIEYREKPERLQSILKSISESPLFSVISPKDYGLEPILKIHTKAYVEYLKHSYEKVSFFLIITLLYS